MTRLAYWKIILKHTLTIFNLVNLVLALMIISVGAYKNLLFVLIAIANTLISIINGIRAQKTVDKMRLLSEQKPTILRDDKAFQVSPSEVKKGDRLVLSLGDQVLFDAKIEQGNIEVNEAFITGEQDNITKQKGDELLSGSFVVSGTCQATVLHIGADNFLTKLENSAKTIKPADSKLFTIMNNIVKYISFALIPIGVLLLWSRFRVPGTTTEIAVTSTVAALINMIPEGLVLLTSSVLALATIRLSKQKVLVQDLYSIETLARVDCIALDKTGTLTTGKMTVHDFVLPNGTILKSPSKDPTPAEKSFLRALTSILSHQSAENATITALKRKFQESAKFGEIKGITEVIDFSSDRKYSGLKTKSATYLLGAIDFLTSDQETLKTVKSASGSYRTLAVVELSENIHLRTCATTGAKARAANEYSLMIPKLLGFIRLEDELRPDAKEIIQYFYDNNIDVKVISGDDRGAVSKIAEQVGIKNLNCVNLPDETSLNYDSLVKNYNLFTRVTPSQKKSLIKALKKQGNTVAMTGDGVNDILALKEADVSLAIGEGSDAARRAAKLVLLNSDFAAVPSIIAEGRRSINNLERSATLFLSKTIYASLLAVLFVILPLEYPFSPIEMSLLNFLCIGLPGLALALENNTDRVKDQFVKNIKRYSLPTGLAVATAALILSIAASLLSLSRPELTALSSLIVFVIGSALIYRVSKPLNLFRASLLAFIILVFAVALLLPFARSLIFIP